MSLQKYGEKLTNSRFALFDSTINAVMRILSKRSSTHAMIILARPSSNDNTKVIKCEQILFA